MLITCVFYAMREGEVRSLAATARALERRSLWQPAVTAWSFCVA